MDPYSVLGLGLYTVPQAARLSHVSSSRIRRWVKGYSFKGQDGSAHASPPVWGRDLSDRDLTLTFRDLIEIRFVDGFLKAGLKWKHIRRCAENAAKIYGTNHPFSFKRFRTDGRTLLAEILTDSGDEGLIDLFDNQYGFKAVIEPYLFGLEYTEKDLVRWWPMGTRRHVVVDPERAFGEPIVNRESVPTRVLAAGFDTEKSEQRVARWFGVSVASVRDAIAFEKQLAA